MNTADAHQRIAATTINQLRQHVREQVEEFEARRAAMRRRRPLEVRAVEVIACASIGVAVALFLIMIAQGFTLYAGATAPALFNLVEFAAR